MSTTINVTVGGNGLLDQSRQQMQANRFGKLERDQDVKTTAEAQQQRQDQRTALIGRVPQTKRVLPEPAANRHGDDLIRLEVRGSSESLTFFGDKYKVTVPESFQLVADGGPFKDAVTYQPPPPIGFYDEESVVVDFELDKNNSPLPGVEIKGDFSIEAWVRWSDTSSNKTLFQIYGSLRDDPDKYVNLWARHDHEIAAIETGIFISGNGFVAWTVPGLSANAWHHLSIVRVGTQFLSFVNGANSPVYDGTLASDLPWIAPYISIGSYGLLDYSKVYFGQLVISPNKSRYVNAPTITVPTRRI